MGLKAQLDADLKNALLGGERFEANTLRGLKAAVLNEEVAQGKRDEGLADSEIEKIIAKEVKKRNESIKIYTEAGRQELVDEETKEAEILSRYLPTQLSEEEIKKVIDEVIAELGASGPQAMGQVIGAVKAKLGNAADGSLIARIVKENL